MPGSEDIAASAAPKRPHSAVEENDNGECVVHLLELPPTIALRRRLMISLMNRGRFVFGR